MSSSEPQPEAVQDTITLTLEEYKKLNLDSRMMDAIRRGADNTGTEVPFDLIKEYWR